MMKNYLLLFFCCCSTFLFAQRTISGTVFDESGEPLIGAIIVVKGTVFGTVTDLEGKYRLEVPKEATTLVVRFTGYENKEVSIGNTDVIDVTLLVGGLHLEEVVVTGYAVPLISKDNTTSGSVQKQSNNTNSVVVRASRVSKKTEQSALMVVDGVSISNAQANNSKNEPSLPAGQLTAGEWKDLDHWSFWTELMGNEQFKRMQDHWKYYPSHRFAIKLSDENGRAIANSKIELLNQKEEVIWEARSDNRGSAELWGNFYGGAEPDFQIRVADENGTRTTKAIPYSKGINSIQMAQNCFNSKTVEVVFAIDATGSMNDEIRYLQSEIGDVISRVETESEVALRCGALYYWGHNSPVLSTPLSEKHEETIQFVKDKSKEGSGSNEFVEGGIKEAVFKMDWQETAMARIVFLLLDEPPRYQDEVLLDMQKTVREAAKKGIKIIPVAASGTNKNTEFLLKFFAMATNGTYTFLTDHSGIGNAHIEPEAGDYNVETLNDLFIRLIGENASFYDCAEIALASEIIPKKKLSKKVKKKKKNKQLFKQVNCFPNPATDYFLIDLKEAMDLLLIASSDAKVMIQYPEIEAGQVRVNTSNWPSGRYYVHFYQNGKHIAKKMSIVKK